MNATPFYLCHLCHSRISLHCLARIRRIRHFKDRVNKEKVKENEREVETDGYKSVCALN